MIGKKKIQKIPFKGLGRDRKHKITLFGLGRIDGTTEHPGLAFELAEHSYNQALEFLKEKGIEDPHGFFYLENGKILKGKKVPYFPLWGAVEERDKNKGQNGEYLAALIIAYYERYKVAYNDLTWNKQLTAYEFILDQLAMIQTLFFDLYLYEIVHKKYSAGESRTKEANQARGLKHFEEEAKTIYKKFRETFSKTASREKTARELKKNHPQEKTPTAETLKKWFS